MKSYLNSPLSSPVVCQQNWTGYHHSLSQSKSYREEIITAVASAALFVLGLLIVNLKLELVSPFLASLRARLTAVIGANSTFAIGISVILLGEIGLIVSLFKMYFKNHLPNISAKDIVSINGKKGQKICYIRSKDWEAQEGQIKVHGYLP